MTICNFYSSECARDFLTLDEYADKAGISAEDVMSLMFFGEVTAHCRLECVTVVYYEGEGSGTRPPPILKPGFYKTHVDTFDSDLSDYSQTEYCPFLDIGSGWLATPRGNIAVPLSSYFIHCSEVVRSTMPLATANSSHEKKRDQPYGTIRKSHLLTIAALLNLLREPVRYPRPQGMNQTAIIDNILEKGRRHGLSKRTLEAIFAEANRTTNDTD